jgi:PAS domain S-box-containing protein
VAREAPLDRVRRELGDVAAALAHVRPPDDGAVLAGLRERLLVCAELVEGAEWEGLTQRDDLVAAAEHERSRYRELFDFAPVAYLVTDTNGVIEEANTAAGELLGAEPGRLVAKPLPVFVELEGRSAFRDLLIRLRRGDDVADTEFRFTARRRSFVGSVVSGRFQHESGRDTFRWMIRDVTRRHEAEEQRRVLTEELERLVHERTREVERERALLEAVIQQMPAGVTITEATTGRLLIANAEAWEIARARFERNEGLEPLLRLLESAVDGGVFETSGHDGSTGSIELSVALVHDVDGDVTARVAVFRDVTARERLERAEREFVTNAAHELQTPLTAITSAAEVLQAGAKEIPGDRDHFLTHIQRECDRLARLVRALLVLARAQSHGQAADAEPVRLRPLLDDIAGTLRPADGVVVEVDGVGSLKVHANRELTEQAITSIAQNAAKFTQEGAIVLSARRMNGNRVAVEVTDTGPGIDETERELVRQRFYRGGGRDRSGFGLGLAIAEQAARALGGSLELEPGPQGGTTARLLLPLAGR